LPLGIAQQSDCALYVCLRLSRGSPEVPPMCTDAPFAKWRGYLGDQ